MVNISKPKSTTASCKDMQKYVYPTWIYNEIQKWVTNFPVTLYSHVI